MTSYFDFTLSAENGKPEVWQACYVKPSGKMHGTQINPSRVEVGRVVYTLCAGVYRVRYDTGVPAWLVVCDVANGGHTVKKVTDAQAYRIVGLIISPDPYAETLSIESALAISL